MMKKTILAAFAALALLACSGSSNSNTDDEPVATKAKKSTFTDERDGKTYKYVKIGTQTWMAENLNYAVPLANEEGSTVIDAEVGSVCYDNKEDNCKKYGRLYYWVTAMGLPADCKSQRYNTNCYTPKGTQRQGICPAGWHLPDSLEWQTLLNYAGIKADQVYGNKKGTKLMSESIGGTDKYGFDALLGGYHVPPNKGLFTGIDNVGWWWTTDVGETGVYTLEIWGNKVEISQTLQTVFLSSVRCVQDDPSLPLIQAASSSSVAATPSSSSAVSKPTFANTFTDERDGKKYGYIEIGEQTWMAENLNYAVGRSDGVGDGNAYDSKCYENLESNCAQYGRLYTWGAAVNSLCPAGWHLPTDAEWAKLINFAGTNAAKKLKAKIGWDSSGNGTDAYGFAALPSGIGIAGIGFDRIGTATFFWSLTEDDYFHQTAFNRNMISSRDSVGRNYTYKNDYGSVRCLKDAAKPSSSSASSSSVAEAPIPAGSFRDERDGKIYKSVKIGKQTWMAENLNYAAEGRKCYNDDCTAYGGIYYWATAMDLSPIYNTLSYTASANHQGICPIGWHIPSDAEWTTLKTFAGGDNAGIKLKAKSGWDSSNGISGNGNDAYGFAALPGGYSAGEHLPVSGVGVYGGWLSTTEVESGSGAHVYDWRIWNSKDELVHDYHMKNFYAYSVRCVKDN